MIVSTIMDQVPGPRRQTPGVGGDACSMRAHHPGPLPQGERRPGVRIERFLPGAVGGVTLASGA